MFERSKINQTLVSFKCKMDQPKRSFLKGHRVDLNQEVEFVQHVSRVLDDETYSGISIKTKQKQEIFCLITSNLRCCEDIDVVATLGKPLGEKDNKIVGLVYLQSRLSHDTLESVRCGPDNTYHNSVSVEITFSDMGKIFLTAYTDIAHYNHMFWRGWTGYDNRGEF